MPELTAMVPLGDREVEMRRPTDGALVVLARVNRGMPKIENVAELSDEHRDRLVRDLGTLGQIVDSMIVKEDDKDWLDGVMIDGSVTAADVVDSIRVAGEKLTTGVAAPAKGPAPVRRRR